MKTTLTIRLPAAQRRALQRRAAASRQSESALIRQLIDREIERGFDFERISHLVGSLSRRAKSRDPWRERLRERNWRS